MATIPEQLTQKIQQTADDAAALAAARIDQTARQMAEQAATQARLGSDAAVASDLATLQGDRTELKALIDTLFPDSPPPAGPGGPPAPPVTT